MAINDTAKPANCSSYPGQTGDIRVKDLAAKAVMDELAFSRGLDQTGGLQFLHVMREGGWCDLAATPYGLARERVASAADAAKKIEAAWVSQCTGDEMEVVVAKVLTGHISMLERVAVKRSRASNGSMVGLGCDESLRPGKTEQVW